MIKHLINCQNKC